jgi:hypothetical protein
LPFSFSLSASGPGVVFLEWFELLTDFFLLPTILSVLPLFCKWLPIQQALSLCGLYRGDGAFSVIHMAIVPEKVKLPQVAMQVVAADVVIDADEATPNERMTTFRSVNVNVATGIFKGFVADRIVSTSPASLQPAIGRIFIGHQLGAGVNLLPDGIAQQ